MKGETQDLGGVVESSPVVEFCIIRLIGKASAGESLLGQLPARDGESLPDLGLDDQDLLLGPAGPGSPPRWWCGRRGSSRGLVS